MASTRVIRWGARFPDDWVQGFAFERLPDPLLLDAVRRTSAQGRFAAMRQRVFVPRPHPSEVEMSFTRSGWIARGCWTRFLCYEYQGKLEFESPNGLSMAPVLPSQVERIASWSEAPHVFESLGYGAGVQAQDLKNYLFPDLGDGAPGPIRVFSIARDGHLIGFSLEHDWDYRLDTVREIDVALPGLAPGGAVRQLPEMFGLMMHRAFCNGASHCLSNMRAGPSGRGFPRLLARVGARDFTDASFAQEGRVYFIASRSDFYGSRVGQLFEPLLEQDVAGVSQPTLFADSSAIAE